MKKYIKNGFQLYIIHAKYLFIDKGSQIEYFVVLKEYEYAFHEVLGFTPKRDIDFTIELVPGNVPMYKYPYRMGIPHLKGLKCSLKRF